MGNRVSEAAVLVRNGISPFANSQFNEEEYAQNRIREKNRDLQSLCDGISDPLLILGEDFSIRKINRAAVKYYGADESEELIGERCYKGLRREKTPCQGCPFPSTLLEGCGGTFERKGLMDPDKFEQVCIYPTEIGFLILIRDITKIKLLERQIIQSQKLASVGLLVSGVVHEIKNLNNCITFNIPILTEYLKKLVPVIDDYALSHQDLELFGMSYPEFREDVFRLLGNLEHASGQISATVSGLREFARGNHKGEQRWVELKQVIERGVAVCGYQIKKMVNSFEVVIADDLPPIFSDRQALEQIVVNLLINAAEAAEKKDSWIRLSMKRGKSRHDTVIVEVSDNGCGMDEETRRRVFEPFFTTKPAGKGTGLGLFVSHKLVEELGGRMELESEPGKGSTFRVILDIVNCRPMKSDS